MLYPADELKFLHSHYCTHFFFCTDLLSIVTYLESVRPPLFTQRACRCSFNTVDHTVVNLNDPFSAKILKCNIWRTWNWWVW